MRFDLLLITDGAPDLERRCAAALHDQPPGRIALLLRDKQRGARELLAQARALREITRRTQAVFLVSDRVDVALLSDADGVHLPEAGFSVHDARRLLGPGRLVGASRHDARGLLEAAQSGADYATLSPVFESPGKGSALGCATFAELTRAARLPVLALGGVRSEHVHALREAGAAGVAVIGEVMRSTDPHAATQRLLAALRAQGPAVA